MMDYEVLLPGVKLAFKGNELRIVEQGRVRSTKGISMLKFLTDVEVLLHRYEPKLEGTATHLVLVFNVGTNIRVVIKVNIGTDKIELISVTDPYLNSVVRYYPKLKLVETVVIGDSYNRSESIENTVDEANSKFVTQIIEVIGEVLIPNV